MQAAQFQRTISLPKGMVRRMDTFGEAGHVAEDRAFAIRIGDIALDTGSREVSVAGKQIHLSPKEFDLLQYLMQNAGKALCHRKMLRAVWGDEYGQELEYLRTYIRHLRKKLEKDPARPEYVLTNNWYGYHFRAPDAEVVVNADRDGT